MVEAKAKFDELKKCVELEQERLEVLKLEMVNGFVIREAGGEEREVEMKMQEIKSEVVLFSKKRDSHRPC